MFESTVVPGRVFTDETGIFYEIPVLLTKTGPLETLVDYLVEHWDVRSPAWMRKVTGSVRLFLEYIEAHPGYSDEQTVFQNFRQRLLTGSVTAATGEDPSGLWWSGRGPRESNRIICNLTDFFNWWAKKHPGKKNPAESWQGSQHDLRLAEAAYRYRRNAAFLGNTWSAVQEASRRPGQRASTGKWHTPPLVEREAARPFPEDRILDLILKGFKVGNRYNYRDMLITLLLNGAGFRESEPFHLYLWDVTEDPSHKGRALVLIHHPAWGNAPVDPAWVDAAGKQRRGRRVEYLAERFGQAPRDWGLSTSAAGWKGGMHESQFGGYYKQAYWFVPEFGDLFWDIWHLYMEQVQRIAPALRNHPFAFVNTLREPLGDVYKMGKFEDSHAAAVRRIGLVPAKHLGTHIHGHRHAYGQRLRKAGIGKEMIRRFMHHHDLESQNVYTEAGRAECLEHLAKAVDRLNTMSANLRDEIVSVSRADASILLMPSTR
ncbi:gamma-mobile-trio recombinase GmtY [Pandoraea pnomenusa]|uniref:gamma-mobile-trio recombinase GmtY n=1 Tax=Pandoraea pnomenusa TaxID=93220 RepID=UPI0007BEFAC8|nr:gamma-mobile-trio recombinase GmtY [Pandoraea pnomenusa]